VLLVAELFNIAQAIGFWITCSRRGARRRARTLHGRPRVDVLIPVYDEPVAVVTPTVAAATQLRGAEVHVFLLDDGDSDGMAALARSHGAEYLRRSVHSGAKAGNVNHALSRTSAPYVLVLDCDHVPAPTFLERTLPALADPSVAFVQTPQYYANHRTNRVASAAWAQQALFFGPIARGKDAHRAMFCCGTNVVFRRTALESVGGFPESSLTEDFELSIGLHEQGWRTVYVPEVLASGLGPEDMASYASQQHRWARGCLSAIPRVLRSALPWRLRVHYLLSAAYFLSGWTALVYMALPVIRILTGAQPMASASADRFLVAFGPYFGLSLLALAAVGSGTYTWRAYSLAFASWWIHVDATVAALQRRSSRFVVTPKEGATGPQPAAVAPSLVAVGLLLTAAVIGLAGGPTPATLNNVAFAALHVTVLLAGIWPALAPASAAALASPEAAREAA
jgi:cellulose synthase (UDP-forming)